MLMGNMIKQEHFADIMKGIKPTYEDIVEGIIIKKDFRYQTLGILEWADIFLRHNSIKLRFVKIKDLKIRESKPIFDEFRAIKGFFSPNIVKYLQDVGFKINGCEVNWIDMVMKGFNKELWIEFGQTRISKLWEYLHKNSYFIIAPAHNFFIVVKRGKNYKKGMKFMDDYYIEKMKKYEPKW